MKFALTIKIKLILAFLAVVFIIGTASIAIGIKIINDNVIGQAYEDVRSDLNTMKYFFNERIHFKMRFLEYLSYLESIRDAILKGQRQFDILTVTNSEGKVIVRVSNFSRFGDDVKNDSYVQKVISTGKSHFGYDVIGKDDLLKEGEHIAKKAQIKIIKTPRARKVERQMEERALVLKACSPVIQNGKIIGLIYGAKILNNTIDLVDKIRNLLFKDEKINNVDLGTTTIFLEDIRVSTNVRQADGTRAIGTQISEEVYKEVFEKGKIWLDKAFVVNNWYLSAYGPIVDINNKIIGIMYVGILEEKYNRILRDTTMYYLIIIIVTSIIAVIISLYLVNSVTQPAQKLIEATREIIRGNYKKIEINSKDEMGYLGTVFNNMVEAILERDQQLKERTERQIVKSAKLASLGRLASGIAHEINNPLTGILTYASLLLEDFKGTKHEEDLQVIVNEALRCRKIVKQVLDFARESKLEKELVNINDVIRQSLTMLEKLANFQNIKIVTEFAENLPMINLDVTQMRSVINNLAMNAADAMPNGGTLTIRTWYDENKKRVNMEVIDTGVGISEENIGKVYDPFFTTKEVGKGTGLGLAVTYGIVNRHNGTIDIKSKVGEGTTFTISLPVEAGKEN
ncbi:MAG: cache domain-containing protein [Spirochaetes bacterium]|nr:cache domain-containing protein [Spirochaetota bacterium]